MKGETLCTNLVAFPQFSSSANAKSVHNAFILLSDEKKLENLATVLVALFVY